jgi:histidinol dehydrogenase
MTDKLKLNQIMICASQPDFEKRLMDLRTQICEITTFNPISDQSKKVATIIDEVWTKGDEAVARYTQEFDNVTLLPEQFRISLKDLEGAHKTIEKSDKDLLVSIRMAISNVREYQSQIFICNNPDFIKHPGIKYTPIERVGICVPGASAPLPSTVIMTAVPAQIAGVKEIVVISPPRYKGSIHPVILAVCYELGIKEVYRIGGAQAVAALAYGTETIPKVCKIVGPGSTWVQMAKKEVFGTVDIDSIAGPSEVLIIANQTANPAWVAADMLSQAEHAPGSALVFTDSQDFADKVLVELSKQLTNLERATETEKCIKTYCGIVVFKSITNAIKWANNFATEHLQIQCGPQSRQIADQIENAGAIFIGDYSPVAVGDYWAGPSHTLPTGSSAWFFSALSSNDFVKSTSIIEYDKDSLDFAAEHIIRLAQTEGLDAHANSVKIRQKP